MKFKKGDVVRFRDPSEIDDKFLKAWGAGPFMLSKLHDSDRSRWNSESMDGQPHLTDWGKPWIHSESSLILDTFLDAARKAVASET